MIVNKLGNMALPVRMVRRGNWHSIKRIMFSFHSTRGLADGASGGVSSSTSGSGSKSKHFEVRYIYIYIWGTCLKAVYECVKGEW